MNCVEKESITNPSSFRNVDQDLQTLNVIPNKLTSQNKIFKNRIIFGFLVANNIKSSTSTISASIAITKICSVLNHSNCEAK